MSTLLKKSPHPALQPFVKAYWFLAFEKGNPTLISGPPLPELRFYQPKATFGCFAIGFWQSYGLFFRSKWVMIRLFLKDRVLGFQNGTFYICYQQNEAGYDTDPANRIITPNPRRIHQLGTQRWL